MNAILAEQSNVERWMQDDLRASAEARHAQQRQQAEFQQQQTFQSQRISEDYTNTWIIAGAIVAGLLILGLLMRGKK